MKLTLNFPIPILLTCGSYLTMNRILWNCNLNYFVRFKIHFIFVFQINSKAKMEVEAYWVPQAFYLSFFLLHYSVASYENFIFNFVFIKSTFVSWFQKSTYRFLKCKIFDIQLNNINVPLFKINFFSKTVF